jgi:hypothetical protein
MAWALIWLPAGIAFGLVSNAGPRTDVVGPTVTWFAIAFLVWGAVTGAGFAVLLTLVESGRSVAALSLGRVSVWGALGCMTLPIAITGFDIATGPWSLSSYDWIPVLVVLAVSAVLGGACAAGTVAAVRRGSV